MPKLPCPVHGVFELLPANRPVWNLWAQYDVTLLLPTFSQQPVFTLNYPALAAILTMLQIAPEEQPAYLYKIQLIFNVTHDT